MPVHEFSIIASGLTPDADDFEDRLYEAGCDDATPTFSRGVIVLDFAREANTLEEAITSAMQDVERAGAKVEHLEPDNLVSLAEIAERAGISRAAVTLYASGKRGKGFPRPVARITTDSPIWDWVDVADWLRERRQLSDEKLEEARILKRFNLVGVGRKSQIFF